jgi:hypothetical protein
VATPYGVPPAPSSLSVSKLPETLSFDEQCTQAIKSCFDACPKDPEKATEKFDEFREITKPRHAIDKATIRSWIEAGLVGCSPEDLVAIHEWAVALPWHRDGWLARKVSKFVMNELDAAVKKRLGEVFVRAAWRGEIDGMKAAADRLDRHCCAEAQRNNSESPAHVAQKIAGILERELEDNPIPQGSEAMVLERLARLTNDPSNKGGRVQQVLRALIAAKANPAKPANKPQPMPASIAESEDLKSVIVVNKSEAPEKLSWRQWIAEALWDYLDVLATGNKGTTEFEELRTLLNESPLDEAEKEAEFQSQIEKLKERPFEAKALIYNGADELHGAGYHGNKRLEILVAGLLLEELGPEIEQGLANTFVLATMKGTEREIEVAAQRLDEHCRRIENRGGKPSLDGMKSAINEILMRDLNKRSLDEAERARLRNKLPQDSKSHSIQIFRTLMGPLDERGQNATSTFIDMLLKSPNPEILKIAFFGPGEDSPPDKTKLYWILKEIDDSTDNEGVAHGAMLSKWSQHRFAGLAREELLLIRQRLDLMRIKSGYLDDTKIIFRQEIEKLLRQPKTDLTECVKLLSTDPEKAANLMVAWAEKYQKSGLKAADKEFNISGVVGAALYGTDVVEVIRLRERFTLLLRGGPLSKMNTEISSVIADALRQAEASKARDSDAETQKNIGAARFITAVLTGEQGIEQMYSFEKKDLDNILKGRSPDELRDLRNAVENYKGPQLRPANGLEMLNRSLQADEQKALEDKYLLNKPLV